MYFHMYANMLALTVRHTRRFIGKTDVSFDSSFFHKNQTSKCDTSVILVCFLLMNVFCDTAGSFLRQTQTQISVNIVKQPFLFLRVHCVIHCNITTREILHVINNLHVIFFSYVHPTLQYVHV